MGHIYYLSFIFNEVLESLISDSNECTLAFNYCYPHAQGNVIGLVSVYIYIYLSSKKNCN